MIINLQRLPKTPYIQSIHTNVYYTKTRIIMSSTIHVSNIFHQTSEKEVRDFFSFCGKITSLSLTPASGASDATQSATVTFERESAAKTALLLDQTRLGGSNVHVEAASSIDEIAGGKTASHADEPSFGADDDLRQEDKPRAAILAEYLSAGYAIGDTALQKGIELDNKHGISHKFTTYLNRAIQTIDSKIHATDKAKSVDQSYHVTDRLRDTQKTISHYFEQALGTPTGKRIRAFYSSGEKQVLDIHNEAKRLAELKKQNQASGAGNTSGGDVFQGPDKTTCPCGGDSGVCSCPPGKCACAGCNMAQKSKHDTPLVGTAQGGDASRQFGGAAQDIKDAVHDIGAGTQEKKF